MRKETRKTGLKEISLPYLTRLAQKGRWNLVDKALPAICNNPSFINWALKTGLGDENGDLRDLAVSILEKSEHELEVTEIAKLQALMQNDENPFVRFRASFALFNHNARAPGVMEKLNEALKKKDVAAIAESYLNQLKKG